MLRTLEELTAFIELQEREYDRITKALTAGYVAEVCSLCTHQLHAILRRGLWVQSQITAMGKTLDVIEDPEVQRVLTDQKAGMPEGVPSKELFYAAEKFGFLAEGESMELRSLMDASKILLRDLFDKADNETEQRYASLGEVAQSLVRFTKKSLDQLKKDAEELESMMKD